MNHFKSAIVVFRTITPLNVVETIILDNHSFESGQLAARPSGYVAMNFVHHLTNFRRLVMRCDAMQIRVSRSRHGTARHGKPESIAKKMTVSEMKRKRKKRN